MTARYNAVSVLSALAGVKIDSLDDINFGVYHYASLFFLFTLRTLHYYNARKTRLTFPRYRVKCVGLSPTWALYSFHGARRVVHPLPDFTLTEPDVRISPEVSGLFQAGNPD